MLFNAAWLSCPLTAATQSWSGSVDYPPSEKAGHAPVKSSYTGQSIKEVKGAQGRRDRSIKQLSSLSPPTLTVTMHSWHKALPTWFQSLFSGHKMVT